MTVNKVTWSFRAESLRGFNIHDKHPTELSSTGKKNVPFGFLRGGFKWNFRKKQHQFRFVLTGSVFYRNVFDQNTSLLLLFDYDYYFQKITIFTLSLKTVSMKKSLHDTNEVKLSLEILYLIY